MPGKTQLPLLLRQLSPVRQTGTYVFLSWPHDQALPPVDYLASFREREGLTLVVAETIAQAQAWSYSYRAAWITLEVHSALEAVGLTAAVAHALASENISCNVWAAYYHDHIFVAEADAEAALQCLRALAR